MVQRQPTTIKKQNLEEGENLISRHKTLLDPNVQFLTKKITRHTKTQENMAYSKEKNKSTELSL